MEVQEQCAVFVDGNASVLLLVRGVQKVRVDG